jgi:hypothetical protein
MMLSPWALAPAPHESVDRGPATGVTAPLEWRVTDRPEPDELGATAAAVRDRALRVELPFGIQSGGIAQEKRERDVPAVGESC